MNELRNLIKELSKVGIKYVVCGGVACVLHGVERTTYDLDLSVDLSEDNLLKLIELSKRFNLQPRIPEPVEDLLNPEKRKQWVEHKNALVYTFVGKDSAIQMDIFLSYPITYTELMKNAEIINIDDYKIYISSINDLLIAKEQIAEPRDKDTIDIKELKKILSEKDK
ncbi:MAG: hypothetical protein ACOYN6_15830 [Ignavibacteria bacterium]